MKKALAAALLLLAVAASPAPRPGWLGFGFTHHRDKAGNSFLFVRDVLAGSPAAKAGLQVQVITHVDGKALRFADDDAAFASFRGVQAGQRVTFRVRRAERLLTVAVTASARQ